jgi:hypothetical protein
MRRLLFVVWGLAGGLLSLSCAATPAFTSQHLADGSYQLQCTTALSSCLERVDEVCRGTPYDVVTGHDHRRSTDITVGTAKTEVRSSEAIIRCTRNKPLFGGNAEPSSAPASGSETAPVPAAPPEQARACIPGATQACVGIGACSGGQACIADGSGFGPCDCGSPAPAPAADPGVN